MTKEDAAHEGGRDSGALSLRGFFLASIRLAHNRLQILSTEIAEERVRLTLTALAGFAGLFFCGLAVVLGVMLLLMLFWDSHRILLLSGLTALFAVLGSVFLWLTVSSVAGKQPPFQSTLDELQKDRDAWSAPKDDR